MKRSLFILILASFLIGCNDTNEPITANVVTYPMTDGTQWAYDRQFIVKTFESETSANIVSVDTFAFVVSVWIDKDTILKDQPVKMFKSRVMGDTFTTVQFNYIDNEGLKTFAYLRPGLVVFAKQAVRLKSASMAGFNTYGEITYEPTPTLNIQLPLKADSKWTYRQQIDNYPLQIDKEVTGQESLKLAGQEFNCFKVKWIYSNEPSFEYFHLTDWISAKGLIKRESTGKAMIMDEMGETVAYGEITETLTLKALNIK